METKLIQIQIALFFKRNLNKPIEEVSLLLQKRIGKPKNKIFPPTFPQLPPEVPRLVLVYDNFKLNFSLNRMDLFTSTNYTEETIEILKEKIIPAVIENLSIEIGRIGFIKNFFVEKNIEEIRQLFNTDMSNKLNRAKEISIKVNLSKNVLGYGCNNIESFRKGEIAMEKPQEKKKTKKEGLVVQRDINTFREKLAENSFNSEQILEIIEEFNKETDTFILLSN